MGATGISVRPVKGSTSFSGHGSPLKVRPGSTGVTFCFIEGKNWQV